MSILNVCKRCGDDFIYREAIDICGTCADDLRQDQMAEECYEQMVAEHNANGPHPDVVGRTRRSNTNGGYLYVQGRTPRSHGAGDNALRMRDAQMRHRLGDGPDRNASRDENDCGAQSGEVNAVPKVPILRPSCSSETGHQKHHDGSHVAVRVLQGSQCVRV